MRPYFRGLTKPGFYVKMEREFNLFFKYFYQRFMNIFYYGLSCFRIQNGELSLLINPYGEESGLKLPRQQNDIILFSEKQEKPPQKENCLIIDSAGEYEVKGVFIYGIGVNGETAYLIEMEGMGLVYLGAVKKTDFSAAQLERLEDADILMVPVGGGESLSAKQATELISELEPRLVIPMNYQLPGLKAKLDPLDKFKKEVGAKFEKVDKLKIAKKDLPAEETKFVEIDLTRSM